jgi:hypothetical protein
LLWSVRNEIGAAGLPVEAWAKAAMTRLLSDPAVQSAEVLATFHEDELALAGGVNAALSVTVVIELDDREAAATTVEQSITTALFDVVGDREVGWTAYDWEALPAQVGSV